MTSSFRPQIYNPSAGQMQRSPVGSFTEVDGLVQPSAIQPLTTSSTINPTGGIVAISAASAITLSSTPTIADGIASNKFQQLILINVGDNDISLQDSAILTGSGLRLFKTVWTIKPGRSLTLIYRGDGYDWQQLFDGETLTDSDILAALLRMDTDSAGINASTLQGLSRSGFLQAGNNLSDISNLATARSNIGASSPHWNAAQIRGIDVSSTPPADRQTLIFDSANNRYTPSSIGLGGLFNQILYRDQNWGLTSDFQPSGGWVWRSRNPSLLGDSNLGEASAGKIRFGYATLSNKLILILLGGGSTNGNLKRVKLLKASDNTELINLGLNSLISNSDVGVACVIDTSAYSQTLTILELEDNDIGSSWAWMGADLSRCFVSV